jgi:hypothetical protein
MPDDRRTVVQIATDPMLSAQDKVDALVDQRLRVLLASCWHCRSPQAEHANGQCLFGPTRYTNYGETLSRGIDAILTGKMAVSPMPLEPK